MAVSPRSYRKKLKGDHALVVSEELHAKVVKCLKRQVKEVGLVNLGTRGLNGGLGPLFDVAPIDVNHPSAGPKAREDGSLACMKASRSEDDNNETKEKFDVMIANQQLVVDGQKNRGHTKGIPQTGNAAKGVLKTGAHAAGKTRQPHTGKAKKGVPKTGKAKKGVPKTGGAAKGPTNASYVDIPGRPECETAGCTVGKRANGVTLAGTQKWRKTCCPACK